MAVFDPDRYPELRSGPPPAPSSDELDISLRSIRKPLRTRLSLILVRLIGRFFFVVLLLVFALLAAGLMTWIGEQRRIFRERQIPLVRQ